MNHADSVKRAALNAAIDYLLADPEKNMPKAMEAVNKHAPEGIFPAQRQSFANAIGNETNWYQLLLKVAHLNPEMIDGLLKNFRGGRELSCLGKAGEDARQVWLQHPLGHPARPHQRL